MERAWEDPLKRSRLSSGGMKGKKHSLQAIAKMSRSRRRLWQTGDYRENWTSSRARNTDVENYSKASKKKWRNKSFVDRMSETLRENVRRKTSRVQVSIFRSLCRRGIKGIRLNYRVGRLFVDIAFPQRRIAIEIDGMPWHLNKAKDRRRNRRIRRLGWPSVFHFPAKKSSIPAILEVLR